MWSLSMMPLVSHRLHGNPQPPSWPRHIGTLPSSSPPPHTHRDHHTGIPPYKFNFFHYVAQTVIWHSTEIHSYLLIISTRRWRCGKVTVTFSVISACHSVHRGSHITTADLFKLVHLGTPWIGPCPNPPAPTPNFKLIKLFYFRFGCLKSPPPPPPKPCLELLMESFNIAETSLQTGRLPYCWLDFW